MPFTARYVFPAASEEAVCLSALESFLPSTRESCCIPHSFLHYLYSIETDFGSSDICKIILAIILPPLGVFLERGCGADLLINILLTILGYIPGIIHALYIILKVGFL
jgi:uncharacterized membrane protein YqaE (UPF0057 family)